MKLNKRVLFGMFSMVLTFGVVLPQNVNAADEEGQQILRSYTFGDLTGKKFDNKKIDEIEKIVREDGKVDATERNFMTTLLKKDDQSGNQILSSEQRKIIQAIHDDYAGYNEDVTIKYPELIDLDNKLPIDLRYAINDLGILNISAKRALDGDKELDARLKNFHKSNIVYAQELLEKLREHLDGSPYREFLTKVYNTEKLLLEENLKRLNEK